MTLAGDYYADIYSETYMHCLNKKREAIGQLEDQILHFPGAEEAKEQYEQTVRTKA